MAKVACEILVMIDAEGRYVANGGEDGSDITDLAEAHLAGRRRFVKITAHIEPPKRWDSEITLNVPDDAGMMVDPDDTATVE